MLQVFPCACDSNRKHSQDHVRHHAFLQRSGSEANPFGTRKRHVKMARCKPRQGGLQLRTCHTRMVKGWPSSKRTFWEMQGRVSGQRNCAEDTLSRDRDCLDDSGIHLYLRPPCRDCVSAISLELIAVHTAAALDCLRLRRHAWEPA